MWILRSGDPGRPHFSPPALSRAPGGEGNAGNTDRGVAERFDLATVLLPVADLRTFHGNPRRGNVAAIAESLRVNGQYRPIVVNVGTYTGRPHEVLAGNHTLIAARDLGWGRIAAVEVDVDDDQAARIVLSDNRTADLGENDDLLLLKLVADLPDLDGTGYALSDIEVLEKLLAGASSTAPRTDPDDVPPLTATVVTTLPGDLWELGPHRLLCGDATNPDHVDRVTEGATPGLVYTDPPYGISIVRSNGKVGGGGKFRGKIGSGKVVPTTEYMQVAGDDTTDVARDAFTLLSATYPAARHVWWGGNHYAASANMPDSSCWLVWDKDNGGTGFADAELAWTNHSGAVRLLRHMWNGMLRASERGKRVHPTQKPVALAVWAFSAVRADPAAAVLDVFAGSGSTLIAAHQTQRVAYLIEAEPAYCDVICRRYQAHTGTMPVRGGQPHDFTDAFD